MITYMFIDTWIKQCVGFLKELTIKHYEQNVVRNTGRYGQKSQLISYFTLNMCTAILRLR